MIHKMKGLIFIVVIVFVTALPDNTVFFSQQEDKGVHWAFLVAGSNGWFNYRHQADVCHAYQVLKNHGIPDERIVVMMYDDIAENKRNPTPGKIINQPNGPDVYHGVPKDYTYTDVNPEMFLKVLQGDKEGVRGRGTEKVIDSGPNDHVFVFFADHGAPGILAFGENMLKARDLNDALQNMYQEKKFGKMVLYIEACESGSMFETLLPKDINVFATTAANATQSSFACYFDKERKTYLGDYYSVNWMQDSDKENLHWETLQKQFRIVVAETNMSKPQEFGDMSMREMTVAEFQGTQQSNEFIFPAPPIGDDDVIASEDVPLGILAYEYDAATNDEDRRQIAEKKEKIKQSRKEVDATIKHIIAIATNSHILTDQLMTVRHRLVSFDCYEPVVDHLMATCKKLNIPENDYALRRLYAFVNLCEERVPIENIMEAIIKVCEN